MPRPKGSSNKKLAPVKFKPPFLHTNITLTVGVEDCAQYSFDLEFQAGGREVGAVSSVSLPALADQPGYTPPPVTSVLTISFSPAGKAIYAVKKSSGVTAACLPAYFESYDSYIQERKFRLTDCLVNSIVSLRDWKMKLAGKRQKV